MSGSVDLYAELGVSPCSTVSEIRRAYKKLALLLHPDKNGGKRSERFLRVQLAYECLRDDGARRLYDISTGKFGNVKSQSSRTPWDSSRAKPGAAFFAARRKAFDEEMNKASESWRIWRDSLFARLDRVSATLIHVPARPEKVDLLEQMIARVDRTRSSFAEVEKNAKRDEEDVPVDMKVDPALKDFLLFLEAKKTKKK